MTTTIFIAAESMVDTALTGVDGVDATVDVTITPVDATTTMVGPVLTSVFMTLTRAEIDLRIVSAFETMVGDAECIGFIAPTTVAGSQTMVFVLPTMVFVTPTMVIKPDQAQLIQ